MTEAEAETASEALCKRLTKLLPRTKWEPRARQNDRNHWQATATWHVTHDQKVSSPPFITLVARTGWPVKADSPCAIAIELHEDEIYTQIGGTIRELPDMVAAIDEELADLAENVKHNCKLARKGLEAMHV